MKPFKGEIHNWKKLEHPMIKELFPESLGYKILGKPSNHPEFINFIYTSAVVKHEGNEIETLNSRYKLIGDEDVSNG